MFVHNSFDKKMINTNINSANNNQDGPGIGPMSGSSMKKEMDITKKRWFEGEITSKRKRWSSKLASEAEKEMLFDGLDRDLQSHERERPASI